MTDPEQPLRSLHQQFCKLAGTTKPVFEQWRYDWNKFSKFYTADDMALEVKPRWPGAPKICLAANLPRQ